MPEDRIVVLKLNEERDEYTLTKQIPKEMRSDIFKRVGSEFDKSDSMNSKEIIRGLNSELEKIFLPNLLGVSGESLDFATKARDFWADYTITPTAKGLRLNITTEKKASGRTTEDGTPIMIDVPLHPDDYMAYTFAMQSSKVAHTPEDLENKGFFDFTLEDLGRQREREFSDFELKDKAQVMYARLTTKFDDNLNKIDWILEMTKEVGTFFNTDMEAIEKKMLLSKLVDKNPKTLISLMEDKDLEDKAFINKALTYLIITKEGNDYFYLNEKMGSEDRGALAWVRSPEKSGSVAAIKSRLEEAVRNTKKQVIDLSK